MLRSLNYYWKTNVAVGVAAAVMTATLTGALVVGDSVRGSLRDLALDRLGRIDHSLASDRFFSDYRIKEKGSLSTHEGASHGTHSVDRFKVAAGWIKGKS